MQESVVNSIENSGILLSRNRPIALVVGVAGFLGAHLTEQLLKKGIQVIGLDNLSTGRKENLLIPSKDKNFHFLELSIENNFSLNLPRLDYAFLCIDYENASGSHAVKNFLEFVNKHHLNKELDRKKEKNSLFVHKTRVLLTSSIELYGKNSTNSLEKLKEQEVIFAKVSKHFSLNARVARLASLFGPRMHFKESDPITKLIQAAILGKLNEESSNSDFITRAIYISDAVELILKTVFQGSTALKIYDGALIQPIKISEIKQILLDPLWYENKGFNFTELPPWPTPNLRKTMRELAWKPEVSLIKALKETLGYFKDKEIEVPTSKDVTLDEKRKKLLLADSYILPSSREDQPINQQKDRETTVNLDKPSPTNLAKFKINLSIFIGVILIVYGLIFPIAKLGYGVFTVRQNLKSSQLFLEEGNFDQALKETESARNSIQEIENFMRMLAILSRLGILEQEINNINQLLVLSKEGVEGINHGVLGMKALFQSTKIISGEDNSDPKIYYNSAQIELESASVKISNVRATLNQENYSDIFPSILKERVDDYLIKLNVYGNLIDKAKTASFLLPEITAVNGKKDYLILFQNNFERRGTGGFIGSYAKVEFENGRIKAIVVDDIYNLDGNLKELVEPPVEFKTDLGQGRWYLRDSNFEPDFPTAARQAEFFYSKESGKKVHGIFALDLVATAKLIDAVEGLELADYQESISGSNLFEKTISYAEVNFFPGSQAKRNFLTSLENQLFNKVFFLSDQNWPAIVQAIGESLDQKHLLIYMADPQILSYAASQNWSGILPRQGEEKVGETEDFLAIVESNMGANKANYYLDRKINLETNIEKEGQISHHLVINYSNNSPSEVFPAGKYKNRLRLYLPAGATLKKMSLGEIDITSNVSSFSDYGRAGYSVLVEILPKEKKALIVNYELVKPLQFSEDIAKYRINIWKQPGVIDDSLSYSLVYPINFKLLNENSNDQEFNISTNLSADRTFEIIFKK